MILVLAALARLQEPPPEEFPLEVFYKDGLRFRTKDGNFEGHLGGYLRVHARTVFDRPDDGTAPLRTVPDAVWLREARLETGGTLYHDWAYRFQMEFDTGTYNQSTGAAPSGTTTLLQDGWIEWRKHPAFSVRLGQIKAPCSAEEFDSSRTLEFTERSPMNRLVPGRELGLEVHGRLWENRLAYLAMASQGQGYLKDKGRGVVDSDDEKELAGLLHVYPVENVRLSVGGTLGSVDDLAASNFDLCTTELSALFLDATSGTFDGRRTRASAALAAWAGPAGVRGEILRREDDLKGSPEDSLVTRGWTVSGSVLLTGEKKNPLKRPAPARPWGALELAARYSRLDVTNAFEAGIAPAAGNSEQVDAATASLTWWLGKHLRATVQVTHEAFEDPLQFDDRSEDALTGILARVQLDF